MLAAELAIDVARQLEVDIKAVAVSPLPFIVGAEAVAEQKEALKTVMELGSLYHMKIESIVSEGNPATEIARIAKKGDLTVVAVPARRHGSFFRPDPAVQLIARCESSVLALSYRERIHGTV
jgi:nucleotide-binding universal stress UspA family protein